MLSMIDPVVINLVVIDQAMIDVMQRFPFLL